MMPTHWRRGAVVWLRRRNTRIADGSEIPTLDRETEAMLRERYRDEIDRLEDDVSRSVTPAVPKAIEDPAVGELREALAGDRRPRPGTLRI